MKSKATRVAGNEVGAKKLSDYLEAVRSIEGPDIDVVHSILTNGAVPSPSSHPLSSSVTSNARSPMLTISSVIAVPLSVIAVGVGAFLLLQNQQEITPASEQKAKGEVQVQPGKAHVNADDDIAGTNALPSQMIENKGVDRPAKEAGSNRPAAAMLKGKEDEKQTQQFEMEEYPDYNAYIIDNLESINSSGLEYAPCVTADGGTLFFISNKPGGVGGHDIWYAKKSDPQGIEFSSPINLGPPMNTNQNEGVLAISADATTIYFTACGRPDGVGDCDIYEAHFENGSWTNIHNVQKINSPYWDSQPSISGSGDTLFFISNRPGAIGGVDNADIYMAIKKEDGSWNTPVNLGEPINTAKQEDSPFILPGSSTLYFSSRGHGGFGGLDFFVSELQEGNVWKTPQNLGEAFNTSRDERFLTGSSDKSAFYFASERTTPSNKGMFDIFRALRPTSSVNKDRKEYPATAFHIDVVPNPATTFIRLNIEGKRPDKEDIVIYDARGKEVARQSPQSIDDPIVVSSLPSGMYIVRIGMASTSFVVRK